VQENTSSKPGRDDPEDMLEDALAEPVLSGESRIPEAQAAAAAFLVLAVGAAAHINALLPLRAEPAAIALHLASALAVFAIARRVLSLRTELPAMACGMIFAVHPLATSAIHAGDLRVLSATLLALLALGMTLAASDASLPAVDFRKAAAALLLYTASALLYPPMLAMSLVLPLLHRVRSPRPVHAALRTVAMAYALIAAGLLVALPFLTALDGNWRAAAALFKKSLSLLLGLEPYAVWHPVPVAPEGWLAAAVPLVAAVVVVLLAMRAGSLLGPAIALVLLLASAAAWTLPLDSVPLESALYPTIAGLALALAALVTAASRLPMMGPLAAVAVTGLLVMSGISTYARHALAIHPLAPMRAVIDHYPDAAEPKLLLAGMLYQQAVKDLGRDAFARGEAPVVLRAGDARSHLQSALLHTGEVLDTFGLSAEAMYLQGKVLTGLGRPEEAAEDLFVALRLAPWRVDIALALAHAYAAQMGGDETDRKAAEYFESAARRADGDEELMTALARHLERAGLLGRLAGLDDELIPADYRARIRELHARDHEVLQAFQENPFDAAGLTAYAEARLDRSQPQLAVYALHEALRRDLAHTDAWRLLADLAVEADAYAGFAEEYANVAAATPSAWEERSVAYATAGHWDAAIAFLRNSLPADAGADAYWLRVADLAIATGNLEQAESALDAADGAGADAESIAERRRRLERRGP